MEGNVSFYQANPVSRITGEGGGRSCCIYNTMETRVIDSGAVRYIVAFFFQFPPISDVTRALQLHPSDVITGPFDRYFVWVINRVRLVTVTSMVGCEKHNNNSPGMLGYCVFFTCCETQNTKMYEVGYSHSLQR